MEPTPDRHPPTSRLSWLLAYVPASCYPLDVLGVFWLRNPPMMTESSRALERSHRRKKSNHRMKNFEKIAGIRSISGFTLYEKILTALRLTAGFVSASGFLGLPLRFLSTAALPPSPSDIFCTFYNVQKYCSISV